MWENDCNQALLSLCRTRHSRHCWRSSDKLISSVLLRTTTHGHTSIVWRVKTYINQISTDTERVTIARDEERERERERERGRERIKGFRAINTTWWWWWWYVYSKIHFFNQIVDLYSVNWITMTRKPGKHFERHTEPLLSFFDLIRYHQAVYAVISTSRDRTSDHRMQSRNSTTEPLAHILR